MARYPNPIVVAMKGHPGTGKSTLAHAMAAKLHLPLLDKDDIRDCTLPLQSLLPQPLLNDLSYDALFTIARTQIRLGISVILDSPLSNRSRLDAVVALGAKRVIVVECKPSDENEWRRRLEERGGQEQGHKPTTWDELTKLRQGYNGCDEYEIAGDGVVEKIVVDTTATGVTTEELVNKVTDFINQSISTL